MRVCRDCREEQGPALPRRARQDRDADQSAAFARERVSHDSPATKEAGITTAIGCYRFRGTGITICLHNGGDLEMAQRTARPVRARTTKRYDRWADEITLAAVERVVF